MRHIHLDPLGGIAGDMFIAALLDAFPEHEGATLEAAAALAGAPCHVLRQREETLTGLRFGLQEEPGALGHGHPHTAWRDIRARIAACALPEPVKLHAVGIFGLLAEAEARVHGVEPEAVTFHEIGAADSVADIVGAAWLIAALEPARWSTAPLPLGSGRVATAHGIMPVPTPATARLLQGLPVFDDGIAGERVTPTGAAIIRHLVTDALPAPRAGRIVASGTGFGTRRLPGIANCLRALVLDTTASDTAVGHRELAVIGFEVDDQSPEDLAAGLERLRAITGVHDVLQMPAYGKKGRLAVHVQLLAQPASIAAVTEACFRETTTIGLRLHTVSGVTLPRRATEVWVHGRAVRVKQVRRPGGVTCKAEADDLGDAAGQAERARLRRAVEHALDQGDEAGEWD